MANTSTEAAPAVRRTPWAWAVATVAGAGLVKPAPGTVGSFVAVLAWWALSYGIPANYRPLALALLVLLATAVGVPAATRVARETGREDPGCIVMDEVAGQWLTLLLAPVQWKALLAGFILFRAFDVLKPFPLRRLERLREGWGVMADDLGAGIYAALVLQLLIRFGVVR